MAARTRVGTTRGRVDTAEGAVHDGDPDGDVSSNSSKKSTPSRRAAKAQETDAWMERREKAQGEMRRTRPKATRAEVVANVAVGPAQRIKDRTLKPSGSMAAADAARWNEHVKNAARRIVRLNKDNTFARVHIVTLTREIEQAGEFSCQAAFYTGVAEDLIG